MDASLQPIVGLRRATQRVLIGGAIAALAVALVGMVGERRRFGADAEAARGLIEADVRAQFSTLAARLQAATDDLRRNDAVVTASASRDLGDTREVFDRLAAEETRLNLPGVALTLYGPEARPLAWAGRPSTLPIVRITGPEALFLAQSPLGLRLDAAWRRWWNSARPNGASGPSWRRRALPRADEVVQPPDGFVIGTSVVPVPLKLGFESADQPDSITVRAPDGQPLAVIDMPASDLAAARASWRSGVLAAEGAVVAAGLLLLCGPLLDWRRRLRSPPGHIVLTLLIAAMLVGARAIAWSALRLAGLDDPALAPRPLAEPLWLALASPLDFLFTTLAFGGVVALVTSSFEQWRQSRRIRVRVIPTAGAVMVAVFVLVQLAAGALVGAMVFGYEEFLRSRLALMPHDLLHFSVRPFEPLRLTVGVGLVILHAALLTLAVLVFRLALARWVVAPPFRWIRAAIPPVAGAGHRGPRRDDEGVGAAAADAGNVRGVARVRRGLAAAALPDRAGACPQAARLTALLAALALPSVICYPSLVDAAGRAHRQLVESRYAPEVVNQRRNLQQRINETVAQIDAVADLADLVSAGVPARTGPPSTDLAFRVWSRTALANQRSTSVELHDPSGALVSRFALQLPQAAGSQNYQEASCQWEMLEEVLPFFAEERRVLHTGKRICVGGDADGTDRNHRVAGSIIVYAMLDYSNLSFISSQSPYVALLSGRGLSPAPPTREAVEFNVYGWSRRPLYMSGRNAWPLAEEVFERLLASREPFWANVSRGDTDYECIFLNDRGAIYALGYPRVSGFGHLITLAELTVLAAATYSAAPGRRLRLRAHRDADAGVGPRAAARGARQLLSKAVHRVRRCGGRASARAGPGHAGLHHRR